MVGLRQREGRRRTPARRRSSPRSHWIVNKIVGNMMAQGAPIPARRLARPLMGAIPKSLALVDVGGAPAALDAILRARIASHEIPPGAKLREQAIADEFGVSRARVRDALALLAQRGLVERFPGRGAIVLRFDFATTMQVL